MEQDPKQQIVERLKEANNVLVTVSNNPSVDQLAAAIGFTVFLNHQGKHATAVFSGAVPSTLEFLQPEKTLEKNTDSLRDFIISLDKAKADKLRYKVEDTYVKIFITPYRTSINQDDLEFSQGDFNVDAVVAIGVESREELDGAIVAHGRILHDATVMTVSTQAQPGSLGTIEWNDPQASSLSEMLVDLAVFIKKDSFDEQMATAFLTGIVAETERFRNDKTSPHTMSVSGLLMAAGANSQLVATKLEETTHVDQPNADFDVLKLDEIAHEDSASPDSQANEDGSLNIAHDAQTEAPAVDQPAESPETPAEPAAVVEQPHMEAPEEQPKDEPSPFGQESTTASPMNSVMQSNAYIEDEEPSTDLFGMPPATNNGPLLNHDLQPVTVPDNEASNTSEPAPQTEEPEAGQPEVPVEAQAPELPMPEAPVPEQPTEPALSLPPLPQPTEQEPAPDNQSEQTLTDIERSINSPHVGAPANETPEMPASLDEARKALEQAVAATPNNEQLEPIKALNAQPVDLDLQHEDTPAEQPVLAPDSYVAPPMPDFSLPTNLVLPEAPPTGESANNPTPPPPVPPPMMPFNLPPQPPTDQKS